MKCVSCSLLFVQKSKFYKMYWSNFANNISVDGIVTKVADEPTTESEDEDKDEDEDEDDDEDEDEDEEEEEEEEEEKKCTVGSRFLYRTALYEP